VLILAAVLAVTVVAAWIIGHLVLLAACAAVFAAVMGAAAGAMRWAVRGRADLPAVAARPAPPLAVRRAILTPPRAIVPAQHLHLHFDGLSAEDVATIAQHGYTARASIEKE